MKLSIIIPSWNNLDYLKICLDSIKKNSKYNHEIIIHLNEGSDGSKEYLDKIGIKYTQSKNNIGIVIIFLSVSSTSTEFKFIIFFKV